MATPVPAAWRDSALALRDSSYANIPWWGVLNDSTLQQLVRTSLRENRDLVIALARVNEARAQLGIARYGLYPQIDIQGRGKTGEVGDSIVPGGAAFVNGFNSLGVALNWEIDIWGRVRRLNESARAALMASEQGRRAAIITVVSEVARAYFELRDLDAQLGITQTQLGIRQQSLDLARARKKSFVAFYDKITSVSLDAPGFWGRNFGDGRTVGWITLRETSLGKVTMEVRDASEMSVAIDSLPRRLGPRVQVNLQFDPRSRTFVKK